MASTEAMGEYIPMILSLQWIIGFEKTSEISSEIAAEFGFFPACEYQTESRVNWANLLLLKGRPEPNLESMETSMDGATIQMALKRLYWSQRVDRSDR